MLAMLVYIQVFNCHLTSAVEYWDNHIEQHFEQHFDAYTSSSGLQGY